ncbi:MAG: polysaccharide deacetylase family protein [Proteobacteria bacterium]|nr:polysaccharide deacetylase family protein [Pseudomonadota bacterium]NIS71320.1 polysaccharide deacetylase family protein [Pseudomonadota bacterium]
MVKKGSFNLFSTKQLTRSNTYVLIFWFIMFRGVNLRRHVIVQTQVDRLSKIPKFLLAYTLIAMSSLVSYSCTPTSKVIQLPEKSLFRSEDYIVYRLQGNGTLADLAEKFLGARKKVWMIEEANPGADFSKGNAVVIPLKENNRGGLSAEGFQTIPILTYHRFAEDCNSPLCMPKRLFELQMRYLKENGYHVITPEELLAFLEYRHGLPKKSVMITMDDGYRSVYDIAYPILKEYGFTATLCIYTSFVGVSNIAITWEQLREMKANGFTVGSHTVSHSDLTGSQEGETELAFIARIEEEIQGSKKIIDKKLGQDTSILAYPFGYYDQRSINVARQAGYKIAMSIRRGGNPFFVNPLSLRRDQILEGDMQTFLSRLKTFNNLSLK